MSCILILAPHCDDEILGCGGTIAKAKAQGIPVHVGIVTNGHLGDPELFPKSGTEKVRRETLEAHRNLQVDSTVFFDFPTPRLDTVPSYRISARISELLRETKATHLYVPHRGDIHIDHKITFDAALVASRPTTGHQVEKILAYETVSETEWAAPFASDAFIPNVFHDISDHLQAKLEAFSKYTPPQLRTPPHPRSLVNLEHIARMRGATVGVNAAEAFMLIRELA